MATTGTPPAKSIGVNFPAESVSCAPGDYILRREAGGRWKIFLVKDIVQLNRLVPLKRDGVVTGLLEEAPLLDSVAPAYMGQIHLLVTAFGAEHSSSEEGLRAIASGALGQAVENVCLDVQRFPKASSLVQTPPAAPTR